MAKREFIDRNSIKWYGCNWATLDCNTIPCKDCAYGKVSRDEVFALPTLTEQDIIQPYLEKIQNKIIRQKQGGVTLDDCLWEIEDYVNSLLSEQGDTDGKI